MKWLVIDSSTDCAQIALGNASSFIYKKIDGVREHSKRLLVCLDELLTESQWALSDLDGVIFNRGPGSFTGLRVACSITQAIAYAHDLKVYPVSSLASIIEAVRNKYPDKPVLALIDARMHQMYWSYAEKGECLGAEKVNDPIDIVIESANIIIAGTGFHAYNDKFSYVVDKNKVIFLEQPPCIASMMRLVERGDVSAVVAKDAQPVYIRDKVT